jgi:hypothetical protein
LRVPALGACAMLLEIEERPVEAPTVDAGPDVVAVDASDAGCEDKVALGCRGCPHAFCDDFDQEDAAPGATWISAYTPAGGPLFRERVDGGVRVGRVPEGISPPYAFEMFVSTDAGSSFATLIHQVARSGAAGGPRGLRLRLQVRIRKLEVIERSPPLPDGGALVVSVGPAKIGGSVISFAVNPDGFYAVLGTDVLPNTDPKGTLAPLYESKILSFGDQPFLIDLYITTKERALLVPVSKCADVASPMVVAARINNLLETCVELTGELADLAWMNEPMIALGTGAPDRATLHFVHDNVMVDYLE